MKRKMTAMGIVLAVIGLVTIVLVIIGLTSKAITAIIERRQRPMVTYWKAK